MSRSRSIAALAPLAAVFLSACATGDRAPAPREAAADASAPPAAAYAWHDPRFHDPWFDPEAVLLPPPPFTGFSAAGKTSPMLPTRPRPPAPPAGVTGAAE